MDARKYLPAVGAVWFTDPDGSGGIIMRQTGPFGLSEHLERLSKDGDPLEVLEATVDFEHFRPRLVEGLGHGDGS
ncbi:hypothetical protein LNKW23_47280 [Paralimibaculum aggregatum]|uniref:Uncharacterized protein n=1 Tax=Paralimibaculum aggregatum TaxID=3036245 RepID=A0ABQ6LTY6_9RHOB|nr:hypothetical protein LNKW23_47280 [Limibaculum sp. NKW23]